MDSEDEVGWHWDKDYSAEGDGVNVHPHIATVTYLTDVGVATMFLEKCVGSPVVDQDILAGPVDRGYISWPLAGKHVSFDGRWLHGAPEDISQIFPQYATPPSADISLDTGLSPRLPLKRKSRGKETDVKRIDRNNSKQRPEKPKDRTKHKGGKRKGKASNKKAKSRSVRITFLVNVWINHKPEMAVRLTDSVARKLNPAIRCPPINFSNEREAAKLYTKVDARGNRIEA